MNSFADALREINSLKQEGLVRDYAVAGAMAYALLIRQRPVRDWERPWDVEP
jgi:hypothetical protein